MVNKCYLFCFSELIIFSYLSKNNSHQLRNTMKRVIICLLEKERINDIKGKIEYKIKNKNTKAFSFPSTIRRLSLFKILTNPQFFVTFKKYEFRMLFRESYHSVAVFLFISSLFLFFLLFCQLIQKNVT